MIPDMPKHLDALKKRDDLRDLANITPVIRKSIFDSKKVEDHHGIIPTDECVDIRRLGSEAENLFDIIARRFIAAFMPDAKASTTSSSANTDGVLFRPAATLITQLGGKSARGNLAEAPDSKNDSAAEDGHTIRAWPPAN